jgi:HEAT repeat protein
MDQRDLRNLIEALSSDDPGAFTIARMIPVSMGDAAVSLIRQAVNDAPALARQRMVTVLSQIGSKEAVDVLVELLADRDWSVRVIAALELGKRGDRRATKILAVAFEQANPDTRGEIAMALAAIADARATKLLVAALADNDPSVRAKAAYAIADIARRGSASGATKRIITSAAESLLSQSLRDSDTGTREAAVAALTTIYGESAIELVSGALQDKSPDVRLAAVKALVIVKRKLPARAGERVREALVQALEDEAANVRLEAIKALKPVFKHEEEVIKALRAVYKRDKNARVREAAGEALGDQRPKALRERLVFRIAFATLVIVLLSWIFISIGRLLYHPRDPLPASASTLPAEGIYGPNAMVILWSQALLSLIGEQREAINSLQPSREEAFRIPCPRQVQDILFGKKNCEVLIFEAYSPTTPLTLRFLVFRDQGQVRLIAIGVPEPRKELPDGDFIELPERTDGGYKEVARALRAQAVKILDTLKPEDWIEYPPHRKGVYIPFVADPYYQQKIEGLRQSNSVIQHLLSLAAKYNPDLSLGARVFTVGNMGPTGMYRPGFNVIQRPMFLEPVLARTFAHELVHAILNGVEEKDPLLDKTLPYLKSAHPQMFRITLPLFYGEGTASSSDDTRKAEEMIAFFTGSLAAENTQVYFFQTPGPLVTDISDVVWFNEPLLPSDVELLVQLGLIPEWMSPEMLSYSEDKITRRYFEKVNRYSHSK